MGVIGKDYFRVWQNRLESQLRVRNILFRHVKQSQRRVAGRSFSGWKVFTSYKRALEQKVCYGLKAIMRWRSQRALQKWKTVMRNRALLRRIFRRAQASWERHMQRGAYHADYWSMLRALERWSAYCRTKSLQRAWLVLDSTAKIFRKHALLRAGLQAFHWGIYTKLMVAYNKKVLAGALRQWQSVLKMNRPQEARGKMLASCGLRTEYQYARRSAMRKAFSALKRLCIAGCWAPKHLYHIRLLKASLFEFLRHICKAQVLKENWERLSRSLLRRAREAGSRALLAERHAAVRSTYRVSRFNELWIERICFNSWVIEMALKRKAGAHRSRVVQGAVLGACKRATSPPGDLKRCPTSSRTSASSVSAHPWRLSGTSLSYTLSLRRSCWIGRPCCTTTSASRSGPWRLGKFTSTLQTLFSNLRGRTCAHQHRVSPSNSLLLTGSLSASTPGSCAVTDRCVRR